MKWVKFSYQGKPVYGVLNGDSIQITGHRWEDILAQKPVVPEAEIAANQVTLLNPIGRPSKIVCVGRNYMDHIRETNSTPPEQPLLFAKFPSSLNDPTGDITWSTALTGEVDFEAELAVIIGKPCRRVREEDALGYVAGYTAANDVSARDIQFGDGQWIRGKSLDTFCPLGPAFVTADEIPDPQKLTIRALLNDKIMQDSTTADMIFSVAHVIAFCSQTFSWEPGDVLLTGTPEGTGLGRDPKVYMHNGDVIAVEVERIGRLENKCRTI
jgi:2-keto-4-pentenoate hydratase/2-oxohepta-3-ene-1,7-dioic acid hydratase in catechol pathway